MPSFCLNCSNVKLQACKVAEVKLTHDVIEVSCIWGELHPANVNHGMWWKQNLPEKWPVFKLLSMKSFTDSLINSHSCVSDETIAFSAQERMPVLPLIPSSKCKWYIHVKLDHRKCCFLLSASCTWVTLRVNLSKSNCQGDTSMY